MSDCLYFAADALMTELHVSGGTVWGRSEKWMDLGPLQMKTQLEAFSDVVGQKQTSFLVQVSKNLWLFLVAGKDAAMYVVDGGKAGLNEHNAPSYGGKSWKATLKDLAQKQALAAVYKYIEREGWELGDLKDEIPV